LTAYAELSLETNSSCLHRRRIGGSHCPVELCKPPPAWHQPRVPEPHGFAVRNCAVRPARGVRSREARPANHITRPALSRPSQPGPTFV